MPIKAIGIVGILGTGAYVLFKKQSTNRPLNKLKLWSKESNKKTISPAFDTPVSDAYKHPVVTKLRQMKNKMIYGTPYIKKEPIYPISPGSSMWK